MAKSRTRFHVQESTAIDPDWEVDKAIDLWERMLASRLRSLVERPDHRKHEGAKD